MCVLIADYFPLTTTELRGSGLLPLKIWNILDEGDCEGLCRVTWDIFKDSATHTIILNIHQETGGHTSYANQNITFTQWIQSEGHSGSLRLVGLIETGGLQEIMGCIENMISTVYFLGTMGEGGEGLTPLRGVVRIY